MPTRGSVHGVRLAPVATGGRGASSRVRGTEHTAPDGRIAGRLASARRGRFVGRAAEIEIFRSALLADELPFVVFHLSGGVGGKTTLIGELARVAAELGRAIVRIDGRNIEASATGFLVALSQAIGADRVDLPAVIERWPASALLLVDTYERLAPLDSWLRQTFLPLLPARTLVVIAGRDDSAAAWRTDVAWATLTRIHRLGNLSADEGRLYLTRCDVPAEHHDEAMAFTRGHPLALSLVADMLTRADRLAPSRLDSEPEIVRLLLEAFVQKIPSRDHRLALHACVTAWATTEAILAAALERSDVHEIFEWLERLPFIEHGPYGLFPHDLARDVVYMNFRWRDSDAAYRVTERVLGYLYERLDRTQGLERQRVWFDILFVQRYNAILRPYFEWAGFGTAYAEAALATERAAIVEMVERHEGSESASIARYWVTRQPEAFWAVRRVDGRLIGVLANLSLDEATPEDASADPAIAPAFGYAERHGPPRPGEGDSVRTLLDGCRPAPGDYAGVHRGGGDLLPELDCTERRLVVRRDGGSGSDGADVHRDPHVAAARSRLRGRRPALRRVRARLARRARGRVASPESRTCVADRRCPRGENA